MAADQLCHGTDVTGADAVRVHLLLADDGERLADLLDLAGAGVDQRLTGRDLAADDPQIAQLAHEGVGHGLEDVGGGGLVLGAVQLHGLAVGVLGQRC